MGYRKLLKEYMSHIKQVTGCDFVELAVLTDAMSGREIGELRSIAAEIMRESHTNPSVENHNNVVAELLSNDEVRLTELARVSGNELSAVKRPWSDQQVRATLRALSGTRTEAPLLRMKRTD